MIRSLTVSLGILGASAAFFPSAEAATAPWVKMAGMPGGGAGRITFDPNAPNTMLVGASDGGGTIFRSADGGSSFKQIQVAGKDEMFRAIAIDPKANAKIAFAYSSDEVSNGATGGVYESKDSGVTWARLANQPKVAGATAPYNHAGRGRGIAIDPTGTTIALADASQGLFYSADLGRSWINVMPVSKCRAYALATDPNQSGVLWAGGYDTANNYAAVLWKSTNFGKSWTKVTIPVLDQTASPLPYGIAILPKSGKILFNWTGYGATGAPIGGVVASTDGGKTWADSSKGLLSDFVPGNAIVADPVTPSTLILTTNGVPYPDGLYKSTDSGATWTSIGTKIGGANGVFTAAARPAATDVAAAIFVGGDIFRSTDHGTSWTRLDSGFNLGIPRTVTDDFVAAGGIYAHSFDGMFHSANNGQSWTRISTWSGAAIPATYAVDAVGSSHAIYVATATALLRSTNAGKSWTTLSAPIKPVNILQLLTDRTVSGRLYAADATTNKIYRSDNSGGTWKAGVAVGTGNDYFNAYPDAVIDDPTQAGVLYAGMGSGVWKSTNSGTSWTMLKENGTPTSLAASTANAASDLFVVNPDKTGQLQMQVSVKGGAFSTIAYPFATANTYNQNTYVATGPTAAAAFAYGYGNLIYETANAGGSWAVIDNPVTSSIDFASSVSVTAKNIYVTDYNETDLAYTAPLAKLTGTAVLTLPNRTARARPAALSPHEQKASAVRPDQSARHFAE